MRFNIYGRFHIIVEREGQAWRAYQVAQGIKTPVEDLIIPSDISEEEMLIYLDDVYHEYAGFGQVIERVS